MSERKKKTHFSTSEYVFFSGNKSKQSAFAAEIWQTTMQNPDFYGSWEYRWVQIYKFSLRQKKEHAEDFFDIFYR